MDFNVRDLRKKAISLFKMLVPGINLATNNLP